MNQNTALLIIDAQYDFCNPKGALFVPNADQDVKRLAYFIDTHQTNIHSVYLTLDTHPIHDISHPNFWESDQKTPPLPFTQITLSDVQSGIWLPRYQPQQAVAYLTALEAQGQFPHFIWPEHCLSGSVGSALDEHIFDAVRKWSVQTGTDYQIITKGMHPFTEHFGIFMAQIPVPDAPETQLNTEFLRELNKYDYVFVAGEAKSHCVATSIKQILDYAPELATKIIILEDCTSDIPGMAYLASSIYAEAKQKGIQFAKTTDF